MSEHHVDLPLDTILAARRALDNAAVPTESWMVWMSEVGMVLPLNTGIAIRSAIERHRARAGPLINPFYRWDAETRTLSCEYAGVGYDWSEVLP
jgi:hypothetical protein